MKIQAIPLSLFLCAVPSLCVADASHSVNHAGSHAPIGVMGDHMHSEGEWMFSLRAMTMSMEGLADGSSEISNEDYFSSTAYMMAPQTMDMNMVMMGFMYAPSDNLTLMVGIPYVENTMDIKTRMGMMFSTSSYDMGDLKVSTLIRGFEGEGDKSFHKLHFNLALNLPTGDVDHKAVTPMSMGNEMILPYPMQVGAGSYVGSVGATYNGGLQSSSWSWGAQLVWQAPLNQNNRGYKIGDKTLVNLWSAYEASNSISFSLRFQFDKRENYEGRDMMLMPMMSPTADPNKRASERSQVFVGLNYVFNDSLLNGHRLALEWGTPVSEDLDGPQMQLKETLTLGWQKAI